MTAALELYGRALHEPRRPLMLRSADGRSRPAALRRWLGPVGAVDERVLACARGPVLDVGCGPGRHVHALARRGVLAVGVDVSPAAVRLARSQGLPVLERSIFDRVPGAGCWRSALLLDGNLGIGAAPALLLRRVAGLLAPRGEVLVEVEPPGTGLELVRLRLEYGGERSAWFDWTLVDSEAISTPAEEAGFVTIERWCDGGRWFARLGLP